MLYNVHQATLENTWFRMPKHGERDSEFGLSRALLYQWRKEGRIKTRTVKAPGTIRGVTFVNRLSVIQLIESGDSNSSASSDDPIR